MSSPSRGRVAYVVYELADTENVARFGRDKGQTRRFIGGWSEFEPSRTLSAPDLEFARLYFLETLDFFSDAEYRMRTGREKQAAERILSALPKNRKRITVSRRWG